MPTIAFAFDLDYTASNEVFQSLRESASSLDGWEVVPLAYDFERVIVELLDYDRIDALAGSFMSDIWLKSLGKPKLPMVNLSWLSTIQSIPTVTVDDEAVGMHAARILLERGWQNFVFAGNASLYFSQLRLNGFSRELKKVGMEPGLLPTASRSEIVAFIREAKPSTSIFCATDQLARSVTQACRQAGRQIPNEIGILGVGNSPLESIFAGINLSSIPLPSHAIGKQAANILRLQLEGKVVPPSSFLIPPLPTVERDSTRLPGTTDPVFEKAKLFIDENFMRDLGVDEVARHTAISRRSLELRFQKTIGHGPYREIQRLRLQRAEILLRDTDLKIMEIATRCGFPEQHRFSTFFRKWKKLAPKEFRRRIKGTFKLQIPAN
ncbi:MAG: substrate-binding domain-containing protein [Opitutae bacterium]|nr:substrate-binding domain-containing protein [Opitutae bacterium]MBT4225327.1 substrate-binding domain-containing protein [Opitutae bacterium]MBT5378015.1 substrate-binding domain-containing protein [Opitutae bacterium]MBT5689977.1 substrate-binding domain-containing protein [Opitutae bacterium]MBT6462998.1 substrate-binding domain-containing protein [Opitutae bacterium]